MRRDNRNTRQAGLSTIAAVAALSAIMVLFLIIFLIANTGKKPSDNTNNNDQQNNSDQTAVTNEPPYIRIPENSFLYTNSTYGFSFAYPNSFETLIENPGSNDKMALRAESALADQKPIGNAGAVLNGHLGAYVYKKDSFQLTIGDPNVFIGASKTGNDTTWKIVSSDSTDSNLAVGKPYTSFKTIKSQTGISVFSFPLNNGKNLLGRIVFEAGDYYILIALPYVSRPNEATITSSDISTYNTIVENIAKTARVISTSNSSNSSDNSSSN